VKVLQSLTHRVGTNERSVQSDSERQLILEAVLPYKEDILRLLRASLADSEATVTALSTEVLGGMSWWP